MTKKSKTKTSLKRVQFEFPAPEALEVHLAGDFNDWDTRRRPMKKDKKGIWKTALSLNPGRY
jgi:1,4-alpha-glucan branching enzyme